MLWVFCLAVDGCFSFLQCNESACTSPYFIHSLRMSVSEDEILAVKERIEAFTVKLRGRDSGGDDRESLVNLITPTPPRPSRELFLLIRCPL